MTHGSLFSGIGGFDLAAEWMGWENKFHCEWNEFGQKVLHHYWPQAKQYTDITKSTFHEWREHIDILTGGFPCQPYSSAGKRKGKEDERHLWPEMLRVIREVAPRWIVGENVLGLVSWSGGLVFEEVQADLEAQGYEIQPFVLPAAAVNAPHRRDRVWFVAYSSSNGYKNRCKETRREKRCSEQWGMQQSERMGREWNATHPNSNGQHERNGNDEINTGEGGQYAQCDTCKIFDDESIIEHSNSFRQEWGMQKDESKTPIGQQFSKRNAWSIESTKWQNFPTQSPICFGNDGLSNRLDGITFPKWRNESIKAAGNAIVPQVVYEIFKAIEKYENKFC